MQKSFRLFTFVIALSLTIVPALHAERAGTNPHPQVVVAQPAPTILQIIKSTILGYFGF